MTRRRGYDVNLLSSSWTQSKSLSQEDRFVINIFFKHLFKELLKYCFSTLKCCKDSKRGSTLFVFFLLQFDTNFFETFRGKSILYPLTTPVCIYDMTLLQPFYLLIVTCTKNKYVFYIFRSRPRGS